MRKPSSSRSRLSVVRAGGGTGGHLYPGIAVAREIVRRMPDAHVTFVGTSRGLEARVVPKEGFALEFVRTAGLKGKSALARVRGAAFLAPGCLDSVRALSKHRPQVVLGVGGYSSGPVVAIAALRGLPTMVLEQNAVPGLTNRWLARFVRAAAVTYEETLPYFRGRGFVSGNPVRAEFFADGSAPEGTSPRVLVLGGSQGAHALNLALIGAVTRLLEAIPGLQVMHQTGERDLNRVRHAYAAAHVAARSEAFLDPVAPEMTAADLVISRAGATTLAELAAAGRPAVLVPFAAATDDHQRRNAQVLERAGAAVIVDERGLSGEAIARVAAGILADAPRRQAMAQKMKSFARPDAASRIVDRLFALAGVAAPAAG
jgi:UDP-N-acetylglucosamine--N-acetylmuramyl-(pentapeptide) pyrophosphoryl-undecaprenol N-acetylglucosamine transferase